MIPFRQDPGSLRKRPVPCFGTRLDSRGGGRIHLRGIGKGVDSCFPPMLRRGEDAAV